MSEDNEIEESDDQAEQPRKKPRTRNMNKYEKIRLIRECCEHAEGYRPGNKTKFWAMISTLLKQHTGYELVNPGQTVTRWVKTQINELVEEEMGSGTEVERDDFKTAVEQFAERMQIVAQEIEDSVKSRQQRAAENLEAARLENSLIFEIDEPIPGVDTPVASSSTQSTSRSIALTPRPTKRKREKEPTSDQPSADAFLLSNGFKEASTILADAYRASQTVAEPRRSGIPQQEILEQRMDKLEANVQSMVEKALQAPPPATQALEKKVDQMKTEMEGMVGRVLEALTGLNAAAGLGPPTR